MSDAKPFWQSKTLWFNVVMGVLLAAAYAVKSFAGGDTEVDPNGIDLPAQFAEYSKWILIVANILLRLITSAAVKLKDDSPPNGPDPSIRVFTPTAALLACCLVGDCAVAQPAGKPELVVTVTEPKIPGERLIIDATQTKAERIEIAIWAEGLPAGGHGIDDFAELIEELKKRGAKVIDPPADEGATFESRFAVEGQTFDLVVLDSTAGAHYVVMVAAFTASGSERAVFERKIPGETPDDPDHPAPVPPTPPTPPGPTPPPEPPTPPVPPTPPTPPTPPEPEVEEGRFKISRRVYEAAKRVESANRPDEARRIVSVLRGVAEDVKDGQTRGSSAIRKSIIDSLQGELTDAESALWSIGFGAELARIIFDLLTSGKLGTWQDWVDLLLEIAKALELLT